MRRRTRRRRASPERAAVEWPDFEMEGGWHDSLGNERVRLVLCPNSYPLAVPGSERQAYRGQDFWDEAAWQEIERKLAVDSPAEWLREGIRHALFNYVAHAAPFYPARLEWDDVARTHHRVEGRARAYRQARDVAAALNAIEKVGAQLWRLVEPLPRSSDKRSLVRLHTLEKLAWGAMEWRGVGGRREGVGGNEYVSELLAIVRRLPSVAMLGRELWSSRPRPGRPREDRENLVVFVRRMADIFESCKHVAATKPTWADVAGGYVGDFYDLMESIASRLPPIPATLGAAAPVARGKAIQRAFDEMVHRIRSIPGGDEHVMASLTIQHALREGHNRRRRRK